MKKTLTAFALPAVLLFAAAATLAGTPTAPSIPRGEQDFILVNSTGVVINKLYVSPHEKDDWEEDILGVDTLPSGQSVKITFDREEEAAMWDLRVEDSEGNFIVWENLNLLEISKVTLHYKDGRAWAEVE